MVMILYDFFNAYFSYLMIKRDKKIEI